ncbi:conjugal transfer protein TrbL family protein [Paenibacillus pasadenensis]|uniref:conjugal transfer protein TrbL family protein n=1 Tax=Paenibacillus pasadenensis TaxID=217090 RepID=UPI000C7D4D97|nr:conjugal transfer protein TrbL family protein [Paenibacillus pasadenensis]
MKKKRISSLLFFLFLMTLPNVAYAESWAERTAGGVVTYILKYFFEPLFNAAVEVLGSIMITDPFSTYPLIDKVKAMVQLIAISLLFCTVAFRLFRTRVGIATGGQTEPLADLLFRSMISGVLIFALPFMLEHLIKINDVIIEIIKTLNVDLTGNLNALNFYGGRDIVLFLAFIVFIVALIGVTISNTIRFAELCVLYCIAPIMAVSHAGKGEAFQIWVTQAIAVTFTQSIQFFLIALTFEFLGNMELNSWTQMVAPIGACVIAVKGPQSLKQLMYSSGVGGFGAGMGQQATTTAIYSKMMKGVK